jgi:aminopeptidase 2
VAFGSFNTVKDYEETKAYFKGKDTRTYDLALNQALEQIQSNIHWISVCGAGLLRRSNLD